LQVGHEGHIREVCLKRLFLVWSFYNVI